MTGVILTAAAGFVLHQVALAGPPLVFPAGALQALADAPTLGPSWLARFAVVSWDPATSARWSAAEVERWASASALLGMALVSYAYFGRWARERRGDAQARQAAALPVLSAYDRDTARSLSRSRSYARPPAARGRR